MEKTIPEKLLVSSAIDLRKLAAQPLLSILQSNARLWMSCALLIADMLSLSAAILLGVQIRDLSGERLEQYYEGMFLLLAITLVVSFYRRRLYPAIGINYVQELREIVSSTSFAFLILIGVTFLLKTSSIYSRLTLMGLWALCLVFIPTARFAVRKLLIRWQLWGEPVAIIGDLHRDMSLADYFMTNLQLGLRPAAVLQDEFFSSQVSEWGPPLSIVQIKEYARARSLSTALVVITDLNSLDLLVERYRTVFQRVILIKSRNGSYSLNSLRSLDLSGVLGLQVMNNLLSFWPQVFKRLVDIIGSCLGLLVLAPFFGLTALLIKLDSPGRVFYRQRRLGRDGKAFELLKFRTMYQGAGQILAEKLASDPEARLEWERYQKIRNDPRITRVGRLLRIFSLDELPQLWNVLMGEMSLVGPRPIMLDQREYYGESFNEYVQVSPGLTGLWQVSGRNETTFARRAELDLEYIQRWSVWLDIFILVKTIQVVFWHRGAY